MRLPRRSDESADAAVTGGDAGISTADDGSDESSGQSMPMGIPIAVPLPGRFDRDGLRTGLARSGRLAILSTRSPQLPGIVAAIVAALWAVVAGLLVSAVLGLASGAAEPGIALTSLIWLTAHHAPLATDAGTVSLLPLGLLVVAVLPLRRAGRFLAAQQAPAVDTPSEPRALWPAGVALLGYAGAAGLIAAADRTVPYVPVIPAVLWALVIAVPAGAWGVVRQSRGRLPIPPYVVAVAVTVAVPLSAATIITATTVLLGMGEISQIQGRLTESGAEQVGITLLQIAYLPNLIVWAAAFVIGTGFSMGADHRLSPFTSGDTAVPDLPILAALPVDPPNSTALLPILVALGGVLGAVVFARLLPEQRLRRRITRAAVIALGSGAVWWMLAMLSGGSLGEGRLETVGPVPGTALLAMLLTGAGTLLWALLPTLASDARPMAVDLRERVTTAATAAKDAGSTRLPTGKQG